MGRLYSNPNAWRHGFNFGRVTNQDLEKVNSCGRGAAEANNALAEAELDEAVEGYESGLVVSEMLRIKPIMEARSDKRCRPEGVNKWAFKLYRKLRLRFPTEKAKRARARRLAKRARLVRSSDAADGFLFCILAG